MKKKSPPNTNDTSNTAIVDGKLILSLPNAQMPVLWQMDLEKAQSSTFTIQEDKKNKKFTLILKEQDESINEIADFDDKQTATDVLMETSHVLQNAHGQIKPATASTNNSKKQPAEKKENNDKAGAIIALLLIIALTLVWIVSSSGNIKRTESTSVSTLSGSTARESSGVPVSADDFLSNR